MVDSGLVTEPKRTIRLLLEGFPDPPALDTAISRVILQRVSDGRDPETLRIHRASPLVAFGPLDRMAPGFADAVAAARDRGFSPVFRLAGGRAAVFHEQTLAFSWVVPDPTPRLRTRKRFQETSEIVAHALRTLRVDARVGAVAGEYCPGEYSLNARDRTKLVGVGQRVVARAAHVGGVVVVGGSRRIREVLVPVNEALGINWDPATVGSLQDEVSSITREDTVRAIVAAFADRYEPVRGTIDEATLQLARRLEPEHRAA